MDDSVSVHHCKRCSVLCGEGQQLGCAFIDDKPVCEICHGVIMSGEADSDLVEFKGLELKLATYDCGNKVGVSFVSKNHEIMGSIEIHDLITKAFLEASNG